jgi:predicted CxxxxCH...CXXCH cytochrome family protein
MGTIMKIKQINHHYIRISLAYLSALLMLLLLLSVGFLLPSEVNAAAITCSSGVSGCHFKPSVDDGTARNVPTGMFIGSHARHSGYSTAAKREYQFACTKCHPSSGYTNNHQSGYKNITGSSITGTTYTGGKKILNTNNPSFGNCSKIYCHSNGRGTGMGQLQYSSSRWGGTETCLGCHGGRAGVSGNPARSVGNFTLSTTHSQHLKYPAGNISCQTCHSKTATNAVTLKNYTGVQHHANGVRDVVYDSSLYYGSYTSYKSAENGSSGNTKTCSNVSCHGGKTRSAWSATTTNNNNTCVHCHGIDGTTSGADKRTFAPGFRKQGTSTDQLVSSADLRVGSHFKHLSSVYMKNVKCNECHIVPSNVFDSGHIDAKRYNSQTLTFAQASSARILIGVGGSGTLSYLSSFAGYTNGTANKAATCSSVYCHGNRMKNGETGGTYRKPYWNYSAMINYTQTAATVCARCHGYPPTSNGHSASTTCSSCHSNISAADNKSILDKTLHINGKVEAAGGDCMGCHNAQVGAAPTRRAKIVTGTAGTEGDDFIRKSRHVSNGTTGTIVTDLDCIICHAEGDTSSTLATPKTNSTYHGGDGGTKTIDLRDVDSANGSGVKVSWPGTRLTATNGSFSATTTDRNNLDSFCMGCHDSNGSSQIAVNAASNGLVLGTAAVTAVVRGATTAAFRPFNTSDTLGNNNDTLSALRTKILNVKDQFNSTNATGSNWASHHNLKQFTTRYSTRNTTALPNSVFNAVALTETANLQTTGESTGLHCSDCHLNELNAHGSRSTWYMLQDKNGADTAWTNSMTGTMVCFRCHSNADYGGAGTGSRFTHSGGDVSNFGGTGENFMNIVCLNCHGGYTESTGTGFGAIHGNNDTYTGGGGGTSKRYRFMSGAAGRYFQPANPYNSATIDWTTTTEYGCYTLSAADSWGGCTKHAGSGTDANAKGNNVRRTRALTY